MRVIGRFRPAAVRPPAVTLAAWLLIVPAAIGTLLAFLGAAVVFVMFGEAGDYTALALPLFGIYLVLTVGIGAALVMTGVGVLRLQPWARTAALAVEGMLVAVWLLGFLYRAESIGPLQHVFGALLPGIACALLVLPSSRAAFRRTAEPTIDADETPQRRRAARAAPRRVAGGG